MAFALAPLPSETSDFARRHYHASGPSDIANHAHRYPFTFRHVVQPVESILEAVLGDPALVRPLIITSDHGYLWQGDQCPWPVADARERALLAEHFKLGRSCHDATDALAATGKVWVEGSLAAARGRFAWGGQVRGATSLFKHGGVSLMEGLVPHVLTWEKPA